MGLAGRMIGGMVSSTVLTLVVVPAIYAVVKAVELNVWQHTQDGNTQGEQDRHVRHSRQ